MTNPQPNTQAEDESALRLRKLFKKHNEAHLKALKEHHAGIWFTTNRADVLEAELLAWRDAYAQQKAKEAFKASTYQNVDGHAKYWSEIGDYNATATHKFFPQEWFDKRFMPALRKVLGK